MLEKGGYVGSVLIEVDVGGILGKQIGTIENRRASYGWCTNRIEPSIYIKRARSFNELKENLDKTLIEIIKEFLWCCGAGEKINDESETIIILKNLYKAAKDSFQ